MPGNPVKLRVRLTLAKRGEASEGGSITCRTACASALELAPFSQTTKMPLKSCTTSAMSFACAILRSVENEGRKERGGSKERGSTGRYGRRRPLFSS